MNTITFAKAVALTKYEEPMLIEDGRDSVNWKPLFTHGKMKANSWQTFQITGFGEADQRSELQAVTFEEAAELDPITFTAIGFVKGFVVSEELIDDNIQITNLLGKWSTSVGRVMRLAREKSAMSIFNNAFDVAYPGWDGVELCGTHTTYSGDTLDNDFPATSFDWDTYWDLIRYFTYQMIDERGLPMSAEPWQMVMHPILQERWEAIMKSPGKYDTGDNHANTLKDKQTKVTFNRHASSTTAYFMMSKEQRDHFHFRIKKAVETKWHEAFVNIGKLCRNHQRFAFGFSDHRYIVGSPGA